MSQSSIPARKPLASVANTKRPGEDGQSVYIPKATISSALKTKVSSQASKFKKADSSDVKKRLRDEQMEALVRDRDAAVQKARLAEQECAKLRGAADNVGALNNQVQTLKQKIQSMEAKEFESRTFEIQMARVTAALEKERDALQAELLKRGATGQGEGGGAKDKKAKIEAQLEETIKNLRDELGRQVSEAEEERRLFEDKLDAEKVLNLGLQKELDTARMLMGGGFEELQIKMESSVQLALSRVDQLEGLLLNERSKSKKYLKLLTQLVEKDDLDVLLADEEHDEGSSGPSDFHYATK